VKFISPGELRRLGVLGMNSRNVNYIGATNERHRFPLVDDKLKTKRLAQDHGMRVPKLFGVLSIQHEIQSLEKILEGLERFVIKPAHGSGGKGILVVCERRAQEFVKSSGTVISLRDVKRHTSNILSGLYSLGGRTDVAMIEDMIIFDPLLSDFSYEGVPDIRVIVYRGFPVMAMMRCATHASDGKANLHQGAVGVGLDIKTGFSVCAVQNNARVDKHPDTGIGFENLQLPHWQEILDLACGCYEMTGLGYFGADIVLDKYRGPMILELNARPGLAIQIANQAGLEKRLQAIDRLEAVDRSIAERTELARTMFAQKPDHV